MTNIRQRTRKVANRGQRILLYFALPRRRKHYPARDEKGFSLIEVVIALALLGLIGVGILNIMSIASKATFVIDERQTADNLAETQMEYVKGQGYASSYTPAPIPAMYSGYTVTVDVSPLQDSNIQKITVTARHQDKVVIELEGYKVR